jgi:predicted PurR-regulated permease PerM
MAILSEERLAKRVSASVMVLAGVATLALLYAGREVFIPITFALTLAALLHPVLRAMRAIRIPAPVAATVAVLGTVIIVALVGLSLEPPLRALSAQVPKSVNVARTKVSELGGPFAQLAPSSTSGKQTGQSSSPRSQPSKDSASAKPASDTTPTSSPAPAGNAASSSGEGPPGIAGAITRALGTTMSVLSEIVEVLLLALFLLAAGDAWREKLSESITKADRRRAALDAAVEMRAVVVRYLVATAVINIGQAIIISLILWALGIPSPVVWGALTFVFEFVPYLGGLVLMALLLIAGLSSGGGFAHALLAPASYLVVTTLQNNVVSPVAYGQRLRLNPTAILVAVMVWYALWGVAGAFLAVPILAAISVIAAHVKALEPLRIVLEG